MNIKNQQLIERLGKFKNFFIDTPIVSVYGNFAPGDWSRGVLLEPGILKLMAVELAQQIDWREYDVIAGIDLSGVSLAVALGLEVGKPIVVVREKAKRMGRSAIVGDVNFLGLGKRVLLVDDAMAGGETKLARAGIIEQTGSRVTGVAVFLDWPVSVDRYHDKFGHMLDGKKKIAQKEWRYYWLMSLQELAEFQYQRGTISAALYELIQLWEHLDGWEDDAEGFLTKMVNYFKKQCKELPQYVKDHFATKGIIL